MKSEPYVINRNEPCKIPNFPMPIFGNAVQSLRTEYNQEQKDRRKLFGELLLCLIHYYFFFIFLFGKVSVGTQEHTQSLREQQGSNSNLYYKVQGTAPPDCVTIIKTGVSQIFLKKYGPVQRPNLDISLPLTLVRTQSVHTLLIYSSSMSKTCKMVL